MYVTVLYSYKKHCRIVRFSNENTMMHALDGLFLSSMHNNVTRVDFLIFHTPHFPHSSFSTLLIFHTPHFPHSSFSTLPFSTLRIFHTPHFLHSALLVFHLTGILKAPGLTCCDWETRLTSKFCCLGDLSGIWH